MKGFTHTNRKYTKSSFMTQILSYSLTCPPTILTPKTFPWGTHDPSLAKSLYVKPLLLDVSFTFLLTLKPGSSLMASLLPQPYVAGIVSPSSFVVIELGDGIVLCSSLLLPVQFPTFFLKNLSALKFLLSDSTVWTSLCCHL